jgi:hypothetical protein
MQQPSSLRVCSQKSCSEEALFSNKRFCGCVFSSSEKNRRTAGNMAAEDDGEEFMMFVAAAVVAIEQNEEPEERLVVKDMIEIDEYMYARRFVRFFNGNWRWIELLNCRHPRRMHDAIRLQPRSLELLFDSVEQDLKEAEISKIEKLFILLDWLGQGTSVRQQHESFNRSVSTVHKSRMEALRAVLKNHMGNIRIPGSPEEWVCAQKVETEDKFLEFDGAFGAIDGS